MTAAYCNHLPTSRIRFHNPKDNKTKTKQKQKISQPFNKSDNISQMIS